MTKILILEDDDFIRQQLAGILQEKGYLVVEAASVGQSEAPRALIVRRRILRKMLRTIL